MAKQLSIAIASGGQIKAGDYHMHGFTVVKVDTAVSCVGNVETSQFGV